MLAGRQRCIRSFQHSTNPHRIQLGNAPGRAHSCVRWEDGQQMAAIRRRWNKAAHNREEEEEARKGGGFSSRKNKVTCKRSTWNNVQVSFLGSPQTRQSCNAATQGDQTELSQIFAPGIFSQEEENKLWRTEVNNSKSGRAFEASFYIYLETLNFESIYRKCFAITIA